MKFLIFCFLNLIPTCSLLAQAKVESPNDQSDSTLTLHDVEVRSTRISITGLTVDKIILSQHPDLNTGMDLPQVMQSIPSLIYSSNAGNNIGYTNMKIRGSDPTRINVTINGVPYNDAESQSTFFVDVSDLISSTKDIEVAPGVGSSTFGPGAFGATININTASLSTTPLVELLVGAGSYNTRRLTAKIQTGDIGNYNASVRLSRIHSDGYVERSGSDLYSMQFNQALKISDKQQLKLIYFGGQEKTGQAWDGIDLATFRSNPKSNFLGLMPNGNYYDNQTDNYNQHHLQFFYNAQWNNQWYSSLTLYTTLGKGYYEEFKANQSYTNYGLQPIILSNDTIWNTDLIRRLWLQNQLAGINFSLFRTTTSTENVIGIGYNHYHGKHYGTIIWANQGIDKDYKWYDLHADKYDFNIFDKFTYRFDKGWTIGLDLQYRSVNYHNNGFRDLPNIEVKQNYHFFNPKISLSKKLPRLIKGEGLASIYFGIGHKEPNRSDYENDANHQVLPESLYDTELNMAWHKNKTKIKTTLFYMYYRNQLILTGKINDVGAYTRVNVPKSYRSGIELQYSSQIAKLWSITANASFSANKIVQFDAYEDDYDNGGQVMSTLHNTDISYSPNRIAYFQLEKLFPFHKNQLTTGIRIKSVSKQYMENTQNPMSEIPAYTTLDFLFNYKFNFSKSKSILIYLQCLNILNKKYYNDGYAYSYITNQISVTESYIYPQAPANFMLGINLELGK